MRYYLELRDFVFYNDVSVRERIRSYLPEPYRSSSLYIGRGNTFWGWGNYVFRLVYSFSRGLTVIFVFSFSPCMIGVDWSSFRVFGGVIGCYVLDYKGYRYVKDLLLHFRSNELSVSVSDWERLNYYYYLFDNREGLVLLDGCFELYDYYFDVCLYDRDNLRYDLLDGGGYRVDVLDDEPEVYCGHWVKLYRISSDYNISDKLLSYYSGRLRLLNDFLWDKYKLDNGYYERCYFRHKDTGKRCSVVVYDCLGSVLREDFYYY